MRRLRVLVIVPETGVVPEDPDKASETEFNRFKAAYDVIHALEDLGHRWEQLGMWEEVAPLRQKVAEFKPSIVFNLIDQFRNYTFYEQHIVSYLQLLRVPFTGCNPRGLVLASDKALSKKILHYHRIRTPRFQSFPVERRVRLSKQLRFPLIVKVHLEEASVGIAQASVVRDETQLHERVRFVHESFGTAAVVEEYIEGRELNVSIVGNHRLQVLPVWELFLDKLPPDVPRIATQRVKWDLDYQEKHQIRIGPARRLSESLQRELEQTSRRIYRALNLTGYGRIDYRLTPDGELYFLEANANPDISADEEMASAAKAANIGYETLIQKILNLGRRWSATSA